MESKIDKETFDELVNLLFSEKFAIPVLEHKKSCRIEKGCEEGCEIAKYWGEQ